MIPHEDEAYSRPCNCDWCGTARHCWSFPLRGYNYYLCQDCLPGADWADESTDSNNSETDEV